MDTAQIVTEVPESICNPTSAKVPLHGYGRSSSMSLRGMSAFSVVVSAMKHTNTDVQRVVEHPKNSSNAAYQDQ